MDYSDQDLLEIVEEIDAMTIEIMARDVNFINGILERSDLHPDAPVRFTTKQRAWIMDMHARYMP